MAIVPSILASINLARNIALNSPPVEITEVTSIEQFAAATEIIRESCAEAGTDPERTMHIWSTFIRENQAVFLLARFDGVVIGFAASGLGPHLHYADLIIANTKILFVTKSHRTGRTGMQLIRETERIAKERGAGLALVTVSKGNDQADIARGIGYTMQETMFVKEL